MNAPRLEIDFQKIEHNASLLVHRLALRGISVTGVTKATLGSPKFAETFLKAGVASLGDSRIENIKKMRSANISAPLMLIRSPMLSQISNVVLHADVSFNTELEVINALSLAAKMTGRIHGVILMVELGDLREGILPGDVEGMVRKILQLPNIEFKGIGTNLSCQSGVSPDEENMTELSNLADSIDSTFGFVMNTVSGGNSGNLDWVRACSDTGRINNLRLGESILLGLNPLDREPIEGLHTDAIKLFAEVIESKVKPSQPKGKIAQTAFGKPRETSRRGNAPQVILGLGKQDTDTSGLTPLCEIEILGASSDHLVLNPKKICLRVGDEIEFNLNYSALMSAMVSPFIAKIDSSLSKVSCENRMNLAASLR